MINIVSVRIRNFRALREVYFKPKTKGITGVAGANGKGKSSMLYATMFALYGTVPPHTTKKSLRRIGSEGQECSVSVVFTHMGQTVEVVRELRKTTNTTVVNIYVDGIPQTVTTASSADRWITERLGIDEAGFLTAFVVRQKELDLLVTALPSERKAQIEKLAGIDTIKTALTLSRKDEDAAKKVLASLPGSVEAVSEANNTLTLYTEKSQQTEQLLTTASTRQTQLTGELRAARQKLENLQRRQAETIQAETSLDAVHREIAALQEQESTLSYLDDLEEYDDVDALRANYSDLSSQLGLLSTEEASLRHSMTNREGELAALKTEISSLETQLKEIEATRDSLKADSEWYEGDADEVSSQIDQAAEAATLHAQNIALYNSQHSALLESLEQLQHTSECPTCHTDLEGKAGDDLIQNLTAMKDEARKKADSEAALREAETSKGNKLEAVLANLNQEASVNNQLSLATSRQEELSAAASEADRIAEIIAERELLEEKKTEVASLGAKAANADKDKKLRASLKERLVSAAERLDNFQQILSDKGTEKVTIEILTTARNQVDTLEAQSESNAHILEQARMETQSMKIKLSNAESTYRIATDQWNKKKGLMAEQEKLALTTDMLEKFRSNRIAALAPEISDYATSLISDITNGDFVEVLIDENFNTSIIDAEGIERPVEWLSGGELSAVAFAIRISIGFIITGGNPEFLWLDEPLTAQDTDRRAAMLSTIRALPIDQIVIINHASEAADIVDQAVTLVGTKKEGTRLISADEADEDEQG